MRLTDYGIHNEKSDVRAHVCPVARQIYVFPTTSGVEAIESGRYREVDGFQEGVEGRTASGFLVPPMDIAQVVRIGVRRGVWDHIRITASDSLPEKGGKSTRLVATMIYKGMLPIPGVAYTDPDLDIQGTDILFSAGEVTQHIQVKCDFRGGEKRYGGTGNLFLQVAERNPRRLFEADQKITSSTA